MREASQPNPQRQGRPPGSPELLAAGDRAGQMVAPEPGTKSPAGSGGASETPTSHGSHPALAENHPSSSPSQWAPVPNPTGCPLCPGPAPNRAPCPNRPASPAHPGWRPPPGRRRPASRPLREQPPPASRLDPPKRMARVRPYRGEVPHGVTDVQHGGRAGACTRRGAGVPRGEAWVCAAGGRGGGAHCGAGRSQVGRRRG